MTFRQLIKSSLVRFSALIHAKDTPFWKAVVYLLGLSLILTLPTVSHAWQMLQEIKADSRKIAQKIPDFHIEDGEIKTADAAKGFIYQTNSIIFTFDPEGKRTEKDVEKDLVGNFFSVGLLKNKALLVLPDRSGIGASLLGDNVLRLSYKQGSLKTMTGQMIREELKNMTIPAWLPFLMVFIGMYPAFLNLIITLFFAAILAALFSKLQLKQLSLFDCLKTLVYCATLPTILSAALVFFIPGFDSSIFIALTSLFLFFQLMKHYPERKEPLG